ncbi:MAG: alanine--tRNA ligase [Gemmatimonadaceae bacterium]
MKSAEIRSAFLEYFRRNGHIVQPSASLVPVDDPTLLFVNAGMVPFKKVFLGAAEPPGGSRRAASSQKCVRAGGKHNDLEQVGHTARHHTFFEMLGNFSFGDYFKRDAIRFAWEFLTVELKLDPNHLRVTVHHTDDDARALWTEITGLAPSRIYGLGDKDNFWQMADTGPCGPCSEIYVDLAHIADDWAFPEGATGEWTELDRKEFSQDAFVEGAEAGRFLEIWNLVFMQYDRQPDGTLVPLPKPSVDTGMGLERVAAALQRKTNNFHTDLFAPIIAAVSKETGVQYDPRGGEFELATTARSGTDSRSKGNYASHRVIADHARAVAFLLADGVFPSNEGRGYVLRRILRRAVRNAWLLGVNRPVLHAAVEAVIASMGDAYPELRQRRKHIVDTTRAEEERFLATIEGGMRRFEELAPRSTTQGSTDIKGTIAGEDAFRLYDTFGFPIDLTQLMAVERGYTVDIAGFERALGAQRAQSQQERKSKKIAVSGGDDLSEGWEIRPAQAIEIGSRLPPSTFVGYDAIETETEVVARKILSDGRSAMVLRETPFYAESGGQISDAGEVIGDGWRLDVDEVRRVDGRIAVAGKIEGEFRFGAVTARVPRDRRLDTERNHTATHLLHAALRAVLGEHVHQAGSLVAPDRLRFDFTHNGPMKPEQVAAVEQQVNRAIFAATTLRFEEKRYADAIAEGAMALFGEKYGDVVRVVKVPGVSTELCGGTHVRNTAEIGLFRIAGETGVAAGVRRIEAVTGPLALEMMLEKERELAEVERLVRAQPGAAVKRVQALLEKGKESDRQLAEARRSGGAVPGSASNGAGALIEGAQTIDGVRVIASSVEATDLKTLQAIGDSLREGMGTGAAVLVATLGDGKRTLLTVVSDDLRGRGVRADNVLKEIAAAAGGRGGGKPHMAQAGLPESVDVAALLATVPDVIRRHLAAAK